MVGGKVTDKRWVVESGKAGKELGEEGAPEGDQVLQNCD